MKLLAIRPEQIAALQWDLQKDLRARFIDRLKALAPAKMARADYQALHEFCDRGVTRANGYGLTIERTVYSYIATMLMLGEDFDTRPQNDWAREILADDQMDQDLKAKMLELRVLMETGTDVARHG